MVKNDLLTIKTRDAKILRKLLKEIKENTKSESIEDTIILMARLLYPDIAVKYFPIKITPIIWGSDKRIKKVDRNI